MSATKFCVVPGREPVRLASLDGHVIVIGETPREIPEQFELEAKAAGCLTESELNSIKSAVLPEPTPEPVTTEPVTTEPAQPAVEPVKAPAKKATIVD